MLHSKLYLSQQLPLLTAPVQLPNKTKIKPAPTSEQISASVLKQTALSQSSERSSKKLLLRKQTVSKLRSCNAKPTWDQSNKHPQKLSGNSKVEQHAEFSAFGRYQVSAAPSHSPPALRAALQRRRTHRRAAVTGAALCAQFSYTDVDWELQFSIHGSLPKILNARLISNKHQQRLNCVTATKQIYIFRTSV